MPKIPRNITNKTLESLQVLENNTTVYSDLSRKGFYIEINPEGDKSFFYEYKFNKNIRKIYLGSHPSLSLDKARDKWVQCSKKVLDGKDIWTYSNLNEMKEAFSEDLKDSRRVLTESEIISFWQKLDSINELSAIAKLALKLILLTGIPSEDLLLATWDDINIGKRSWLLNSKEEVFLNSLSVEMLLEIQDFEHHTAYSNTALKQAIIDTNNKVINLSPNTLDRALSAEGCKRLGVPPFLPDDLAETHSQLVKINKEKNLSLDGSDSEFISKFIKSSISI